MNGIIVNNTIDNTSLITTTYTENNNKYNYNNISALELNEKFIAKKEYDDKTANDYRRDIQEFMFIMTKQHDLHLISITDLFYTPIQIDDRYIDALSNSIKSKDLKKNSANTKIAHICAFYEWLVKKFRVHYNPFNAIDRFKVDRKKDNVGSDALTEDELNRIFDYLDEYSKINPVLGKRNRLMIELDLNLWLRRKALSQLTLNDFVQLDNGNYLCIKEDKFEKENFNVIDADLYNRLVEFYNENKNSRREYYSDNSNAVNNHDTIFGIGDAMFNNVIKDIAKAIGIDNKKMKITAHSLRKTGVTISLANGANKSDVQRQAGHSKEETLNIYDKNSEMGNNVVGMNMMNGIMGKRDKGDNDICLNKVKNSYTVDTDKVNDVQDIVLSELNDTETLNLIKQLKDKLKVSRVG